MSQCYAFNSQVYQGTVFCKSALRIRTKIWRACSVQSISLLAGRFILYTLTQDLILARSGSLLSPPQFLRAFVVLVKCAKVRSESGVRLLLDFFGDLGLHLCCSTCLSTGGKQWSDKVCSWYWGTRVVKRCPVFATAETHHGTDWALQQILIFLLVNMK